MVAVFCFYIENNWFIGGKSSRAVLELKFKFIELVVFQFKVVPDTAVALGAGGLLKLYLVARIQGTALGKVPGQAEAPGRGGRYYRLDPLPLL